MEQQTSRPRSMTDIANMLGISKVSVSLALRNSPTISPELRSRVRRIAEETGFKARDYRKRTRETAPAAGKVAMLTCAGDVNDPVAQVIISSMMRRLAQLKVEFREIDVEQVENEPGVLTDYSGLIYYYCFHPWNYPQLHHIPQAVIMNEEVDLGPWDSYKPNEFFAGKMAANYLVGQGFRQAVLAYNPRWAYRPETHARLEGCRRCLREAGVEFAELSFETEEGPQNHLRTLTAAWEKFGNRAGIFAFCDQMAYEVCQMLGFAGIERREKELEVVSCDNTYLIRDLRPALPVVDLHIAEVAATAVDGLLWRMKNPQAGYRQVQLNPELILPVS